MFRSMPNNVLTDRKFVLNTLEKKIIQEELFLFFFLFFVVNVVVVAQRKN